MFRNVASQKVAVYAWANDLGTAKTGDAANITAQISIDGGATAATNDVNPTELDSTDAPGVYLFDLTQAETNGDLIVISPVSATTDVVLRPVFVYTTLSIVEGSYDIQDVLKILLAFAAGKVSGAGSTEITYRDTGDAINRIVKAVDSRGNRSAVTLDVT